MLSDYPKIRSLLYKIQWVTSGAMLLIGVGFGAATKPLPDWYGIVAAVLTAFWTYTGVQADTNTPTDSDERGEIHAGLSGVISVLLAVFLVLAILWLIGIRIHVG